MTCNADQLDALKEIINIGVGRGADVLNSMLGLHVRLNVPDLTILSLDDFNREMRTYGEEHLSCVCLPFKGSSRGVAELVFPCEIASRLISALIQDNCEIADMDCIRAAALTEVGNIVLNAVMGTISNMLEFRLEYSIPDYTQTRVNTLLPLDTKVQNVSILLAKTRFLVEELEIVGKIILFLEVASLKDLLEAIDASTQNIQ